MPRCLTALAISLALVGCDSIFGSDFEVVFDTQVNSVETVTDSLGTRVTCGVVLTATAAGAAGERAGWGESVWTLRRVSDGTEISSEARSSAVISSLFGSLDIGGGESSSTNLIERTAPEPFTWDFELNYRLPSGSRASASTSATCQ
jgi:hypothetical protein